MNLLPETTRLELRPLNLTAYATTMQLCNYNAIKKKKWRRPHTKKEKARDELLTSLDLCVSISTIRRGTKWATNHISDYAHSIWLLITNDIQSFCDKKINDFITIDPDSIREREFFIFLFSIIYNKVKCSTGTPFWSSFWARINTKKRKNEKC